jgi:hypothetical protein
VDQARADAVISGAGQGRPSRANHTLNTRLEGRLSTLSGPSARRIAAFDMHPRDIATTTSKVAATFVSHPPVGFFVNALVTTRAVGIHAAEGLTPGGPLCASARIKLDEGMRTRDPATERLYRLVGNERSYGRASEAPPTDPHMLPGAGGGTLVFTLCGSRMPSTAW